MASVRFKSAALSVAMFTGVALAAYADPVQRADVGPTRTRIAALPHDGEAPNSIPPVTVHAPAEGPAYYDPYTTGLGPRASSANTVKAEHFRVWAGYDADVALHPYTSNVGPCAEGALGSGCDRPTGKVIQPSHYERRPFTD
jgi:hypothetical protein